MVTRTGGFRIGFRVGWSDWQKDKVALATWGKDAGFSLIDLGAVSSDEVESVKATGIDVVSVDLPDWPALLSPDAGKRKAAVETCGGYIREMAANGVKVFFMVAIPEDGALPGKENFRLAVESLGALAAVAEAVGTMVVLEGWPGGPPFSNLFCNPESCRALFKEIPNRGVGLNYDPSHLIRMGIDHARFIDEFADRVGHVHGKDTELIGENLYDIGVYQSSIFQEPYFCGEHTWRYTIPGHGVTRWSHVFSTLASAGFVGAVSVELEDANYNGTEAGEKAGLTTSLQYLCTV